MGLFGKLFDKKVCSICGGEIGLLGNRKLEDGNMCKECAQKLSPFFSERRSSTVADIEKQLAYREENKKAAAQFHTTKSFGRDMKVLLDEDARKFVVTRARSVADANPDVIDYADVTGVDLDIDENRREEKREDKEGKKVSYIPPRYRYSYDFHVIIRVNHPYFDEIKVRLCSSGIDMGDAVPESRKPDPRSNLEYAECEKMGNEIKRALTGARQMIRDEIEAENAPKIPVNCPWCGATTVAGADGCCEYCGGALK